MNFQLKFNFETTARTYTNYPNFTRILKTVLYKKQAMLKKLFKKNRNPFQIIGAAIGAFIGLFLLLFALQVYFDFQQILKGSNEGDNYVTINKPVSLVNTFLGKSVFTPQNIQDLENQPFTEGVGQFTANRFKVSASSKMISFYTEFFLESIPESFIDVQDPMFRWFEGQNEIPIIMSKDYLALYNFGFALSQGLPQFTPSTIRQVTVDINVRGNGRETTFTGRIIGFSDRINSILVPEKFMKWANEHYGDQPDAGTSRILLKVKNPYDKKLTDYLNEKGYELSTGRLVGGRMASILNAVISTVSVIGVILMILSVIVFVLNYQLIISKSAPDIRLLLQIGYRPAQISEILRGSLLKLLGSVFIAIIVALFAIRYGIIEWFSAQGFQLSASYHWLVIALGLFLMVFIILINFFNIRKSVLEQF